MYLKLELLFHRYLLVNFYKPHAMKYSTLKFEKYEVYVFVDDDINITVH